MDEQIKNQNVQFKNKLIIIKVCLRTPFSEGLYHIKTRQLICNADQITGFWKVRVFSVEMFTMFIMFKMFTMFKMFINYDSVIIQL